MLIFTEDSAVFKNQGRVWGYRYIQENDLITFDQENKSNFRLRTVQKADSMILQLPDGQGQVKAKRNVDAVRLNYTKRLNDFEQLKMADPNSLVKSWDFKSIEFSSSACMGNCPIVQSKLFANGKLEWNGKAHTSSIGRHTGKLNKDQLRSICTLVKNADLTGLKSRLKTPLDFPTYRLTIDYGSEQVNYMGYGFYQPLNELIQQFLDFDTTLKLRKLE